MSDGMSRLGRRQRVAVLVGGLLLSMTIWRSPLSVADEPLPRRGLMGVQLAPLSDSLKESLGLDSTKGVVITVVMPDTAAQKAGLQGNDVLVKVGDVAVEDVQGAMRALRAYYAGDKVKLTLLRQKETVTAELTLNPRPKESADDYEVVYDSFGAKGDRIRAIITRPKGDAKSPAVLFVQGPAPFPMDFTVFPQHPFKGLVEQLTRDGFVVMRVERPGVGDSEGLDVQTVRMKQDIAVFKGALKKLKNLPYVDPGKVFVFSHSGGTILAPSIAEGESLRGIITYAAFSRPLVEDTLDANVRRWKLELLTEEEIKAKSEQLTRFYKGCYVEKQAPKDVLAKYPELKELVDPMLQGDAIVDGIHYQYWQELAASKPLEAWSKVDAPLLALWGDADFVACKENSELIVSTVNRAHPNRAELMVVSGADHMYNKVEDAEESFLAGGRGTYNPEVLEAGIKWMKAKLGAGS